MPTDHPPRAAPQPGRILLVVPAFRESARLPAFLARLCRAVDHSGLPIEILPVDDGSGEAEAAAMLATVTELQRSCEQLAAPLLLPDNIGKGGAVYAGWDSVPPERFAWLAFVDADGAVSPAETVRLLAMTRERDPQSRHCLFAIRVADAGTEVHRTRIRGFLGKLFRLLVRLIFALPCRDTQCGLKCIPSPTFHELRDLLVEKRFTFDVELAARLMRADHTIEEVPISWEESPGTHIDLIAAARMLSSLFAIRWRLFRRA